MNSIARIMLAFIVLPALTAFAAKDPTIDQALDTNRGETDPAKKKELAETVNKTFATECYNLWGSYTIWGLAHTPKVQGLEDFVAPSGEKICLCNGIAGTIKETFSPPLDYKYPFMEAE